MQLYLSFLSLAKIIELAKRVDKKTFASIVEPVKDIDSVLEVVDDIKLVISGLLPLYMPWLPTLPLHQGLTWDPTWKALMFLAREGPK